MTIITIEISGPRRSGKTTIAVPLIEKAIKDAGYKVEVHEHKRGFTSFGKNEVELPNSGPHFVIVDKS